MNTARFGRPRYAIAAIATMMVLLHGIAASAQRPPSAPKPKPAPAPPAAKPASAPPNTRASSAAAAAAAVRPAFRAVLAQPAVAAAVRTEIAGQLRANRPVALINGVWVTPINVGRIYGAAPVRTALAANLGASGPSLISDAIADPGQLVVALTPGQLGSIMGSMAHDVMASLGVDAIKAKMTDFGPGVLLIILAGMFTAGGATRMVVDGYYDTDNNAATPPEEHYDPNADQNGNGIPASHDPDDDGDGYDDWDPDTGEGDEYPEDPNRHICDCGRPNGAFFGATFPQGLAAVLFSAFDQARAQVSAAISVGSVRAAGQVAAIRVVIP